MATQEYEVLVRRDDGHETVVRVQASSQTEARRRVEEQQRRGPGPQVGKAAPARPDAASQESPAAAPAPGDSGPQAVGEQYDPDAHTVEQVNAHLDTVGEQERERILQAERNGRARKGIVG